MKDRIWVTKDGRMLRVSEMETKHILNCIARIQRRWPWRAHYLDRLLLELQIRSMDSQ